MIIVYQVFDIIIIIIYKKITRTLVLQRHALKSL